ncbi:hypothetical protein B9P52_04705 [Achromobacter denitrificans]|uniref:hypothetical protein n=1 Tax=Achromobacter denitrificans TaxID=32002 RepID=UPI000B4DB8E6|nr:hypothetical protein [Achromobacter denitrificans]ASC63634.1 hypothetical protein B9P52_04705 [Achromobacter denitrificans]
MSEKNEWKLAPTEATPEMVAGYWDCARQPLSDAEFPRAIYRAMLALAPAPSAPGDAQDERQGWMECEMRQRMVTDNLRFSASHMRDKEHRCRNAYQLEYMGAPMRWLADAYAEAAAVLEAKLAALAAQVPQQGEA